jgi:hypothetical protein
MSSQHEDTHRTRSEGSRNGSRITSRELRFKDNAGYTRHLSRLGWQPYSLWYSQGFGLGIDTRGHPGVALNALIQRVHDALQGLFRAPVMNKRWRHFLDLIGGALFLTGLLFPFLPQYRRARRRHEAGSSLLAPSQRYFYRFTYIYGPVRVLAKWHLFDDFYVFTKDKRARDNRPGDRTVVFSAGSCSSSVAFDTAVFLSVLPSSFLHAGALLQGLIMSVVFQLAHCNEDAGSQCTRGKRNRWIRAGWCIS